MAKKLSFLFLALALVLVGCNKPAPVDPGNDPVDPGGDPVDPGTDPVDPGTDPVDPGGDPEPPQHEHEYTTVQLVSKPTETTEGSLNLVCECGESISRKILKLPALRQEGTRITWTEVENASGYYFFANGTKTDVGSLTSYTITMSDLENGEYSVVAYPDDKSEEYYYYEEEKSSIALGRSNINVQLGYNNDFEIDESTFEVPAGVEWSQYPYGNWSDASYYIERGSDNNAYAKIPATVWYPKCTKLQKDMGYPTTRQGKYRIMFDLKLSQTANDAHTASGQYGHLEVALWTGLETYRIINEARNNIKVANTETWTTVGFDYELDKDYGSFMHVVMTYWPEVDINENYVLVDNIAIYKYEGDVLGTENMDTIEGGDFEKWNYNKLPVNTWCANNTIDIEDTALGSKMVDDDSGRALQITGSGPVAKFNIAGNTDALGKGGIFELHLDMKKGATFANPVLTMAMWSWAGSSSAYALVDEIKLDVSEVNSETFTTLTAKFISKGMEGCTAINIFFCLYFNGVENAEDRYAIFDNLCIYRVDSQEKDSTNILFIGNSFGIDTIEYLYPILENVGLSDNVNIYEVYIGGSSIDQHYENYIGEKKAYELVKYNGTTWEYFSGWSIQHALTLHSKWDIINFQQSTIIAYNENTFSNLERLAGLIRKEVGNDTVFSFLMSWAYSATNDTVISKFDSDPYKMYQALITNYEHLFGQETNPYQITKLVPTSTSIENARPFYGQGIYRDDLHLNFGLGRFIAGLTWASAVFGFDPETVTYKTSDMTGSDLQIIIQCVKAALAKPFERSEVTIS